MSKSNFSDEEMNISTILCAMLTVQDRAPECPPFFSLYKESSSKSLYPKLRYSLSVHNKVLFVCLDYSSFLDRLLAVKHPSSVIDGICDGDNVGMTSGHLVSMAYMVPYALIFRTLSLTDSKLIVFCGSGLSGSIAHTCALICRHYAIAAGDQKLLVKCISLSGPLIGNQALHAYLKNNNASNLHVTVNHAASVLDRLILDLSLLSLLLSTSDHSGDQQIDHKSTAWANAYGIIYHTLRKYLTGFMGSDSEEATSQDLLEKLCQAEISLHPLIMSASIIEWAPIGQYLFVPLPHLQQRGCTDTPEILPLPSSTDAENIWISSDEISLREKLNMIWTFSFTGHNSFNIPLQAKSTAPLPSTEKIRPLSLDLMPKLSSCHMQYSTHLTTSHAHDGNSQVQFVFEGRNIDTVLYREWGREVKITSLDHSHTDLPFTISHGSYTLSKNASIMLVQVQLRENGIDLVSVQVRGLEFTAGETITVQINTDFGSSNEISIQTPQPPPPLQLSALLALHPTMNTSFLMSAVVRAAVCFRDSIVHDSPSHMTSSDLALFEKKHKEIFELWELIVSIEKELFDPSELLLEACMKMYVHDRNDIAIFVNTCLTQIERMSSMSTSLHFDENVIIRGARTVLGGIGRVGGGVVSAAGALLTLPSILLSAPVIISEARRQSRQNTQDGHNSDGSFRIGMGTGAYLGVMGLLGVPGLLVSGIGQVISTAGAHAMMDYDTVSYKKILRELISTMGGHIEDIVDEITPLENHVIVLFYNIHAGFDLRTCSMAELKKLIDSSEYTGKKDLKKIISHNPAVASKLWLVGRFQRIRQIMANNITIAFVGLPQTGKSTILNRLFDIENTSTSISGVQSMEPDEPVPHRVGTWVDDVVETNSSFADWIHSNFDATDRLSPGNVYNSKLLQLYAIDYRGSASSTSSVDYVANMASVFVITLNASDLDTEALLETHLAGVEAARQCHKPFIVAVNRVSNTDNEFLSAGQYESICEGFARKLMVPVEVVCLIEDSVEMCIGIHKLRSILFTMLYALIGASSASAKVLSLRFLSNKTMSEDNVGHLHSTDRCIELENMHAPTTTTVAMNSPNNGHQGGIRELVHIPDIFTAATTSLLLNTCPVNAENLKAACMEILQVHSTLPSSGSSYSLTASLSSSVSFYQEIRDTASNLRIHSEAYSVFIAVFQKYAEFIKDKLSATGNASYLQLMMHLSKQDFNSLHNNVALGVFAKYVTLLVQSLTADDDIILSSTHASGPAGGKKNETSQDESSLQLTLSAKSDKTSTSSWRDLLSDVLLHLNVWVRLWMLKGYSAAAVRHATEATLMQALMLGLENEDKKLTNGTILSEDSLNPSKRIHSIFLQLLDKHATILDLIQEHASGMDPSNMNGASASSHSHVFSELNLSDELENFILSSTHLAQLAVACKFQPFAEIQAVNQDGINVDGETIFKEVEVILKQHSNSQNLFQVPIALSKNTDITLEVLNGLMSLSTRDLHNAHVAFSIKSESAVDMNGVTRSVLSQVAQEINSNPEAVLLRKDEDSGLLYFDPEVCNSRDRIILESAYHIYAGLGRLVGLSILKSPHGTTLPINFAITVYRLILGYPIGMNDLEVISPAIASSLKGICALDSSTLEMSGLDFTLSARDHSPIPLCPHGEELAVSAHNRVQFILSAVRFYLCRLQMPLDTGNIVTVPGPGVNLDDAVEPVSPLWYFVMGVQSMCPRDYFHLLSPVALQMIIEGNKDAINVSEWQNNTVYKGGSTLGKVKSNDLIARFWHVVENLSEVDRKYLLCFTIGSTSLPHGGFASLDPKFTLVIGEDMSSLSLPISHTCFHMLVLPPYSEETTLREKLLQAIRETGITDMGIV